VLACGAFNHVIEACDATGTEHQNQAELENAAKAVQQYEEKKEEPERPRTKMLTLPALGS
jgi:hypothetical protein